MYVSRCLGQWPFPNWSSRQDLIPKNHLQKGRRIAVRVKLFSICKIPKVGDGGASLPAGGSYGGVRMEAIVDLPTSPSPRSPVCRYSSCWWGQRCHRRRSQKPLSLRFHQASIQEHQSSKVFFLPLLCHVIPFLSVCHFQQKRPTSMRARLSTSHWWSHIKF